MTKIYFALLVFMSIGGYAQVQKDTIKIDEVIINENRFSTPISKKIEMYM